MELSEKLQELRKQKGLTQEALAAKLYVSRTAVSKWESGRGYPNIESLKELAKFFGVTVDELLSGEELLSVAQEEARQKEKHMLGLLFGLLDLSAAMLLFLPLFGMKTAEGVLSVSLLNLAGVAPYVKTAYYVVLIGLTAWGVLLLALQNCRQSLWERCRQKISLLLNGVAAGLFIISQQPYGAIFLLVILGIKVLILVKKR